MDHYPHIPHPYSTPSLRARALLRADRNDYQEMLVQEEQRIAGLKPAVRASINMDVYEVDARNDRFEG